MSGNLSIRYKSGAYSDIRYTSYVPTRFNAAIIQKGSIGYVAGWLLGPYIQAGVRNTSSLFHTVCNSLQRLNSTLEQSSQYIPAGPLFPIADEEMKEDQEPHPLTRMATQVMEAIQSVATAVTFPFPTLVAAKPSEEMIEKCRVKKDLLQGQIKEKNIKISEIDVKIKERFSKYRILVDESENLPLSITIEGYANPQASGSIKDDSNTYLSSLAHEKVLLEKERNNLETQYIDLFKACMWFKEEKQNTEF